MITAKILSVNTDENGNIKVSTEYSQDGQVIQVGNTRYTAMQSLDKNAIIARIDTDIQTHCNNLIARKFVETKNVDLSTELASVVNKTYQYENTKIIVDGKELTIDEDLVISEKPAVEEII